MSVRVLVVDDEELARRKIVRLLTAAADICVVGECGDGARALERIRTLQPDLVFLDIQMPGYDGFEVLRRLGPQRPEVVFVTAFDEYALAAFDVAAVDYVLKPFARARLQRALERARRRLQDEGRRDEVAAVLRAQGGALPERLVVRHRGRVELVATAQVRRIEADGNYVRLYTGRREILMRATLTAVIANLDPARFLRVHRSRIVNFDYVTEVVAGSHGDYVLRLDTGEQVHSSRTYHADVAGWIAAESVG